MTEAEVTRDFAAVLERVRQGVEVVVEQDHQAVAVLSPQFYCLVLAPIRARLSGSPYSPFSVPQMLTSRPRSRNMAALAASARLAPAASGA